MDDTTQNRLDLMDLTHESENGNNGEYVERNYNFANLTKTDRNIKPSFDKAEDQKRNKPNLGK